MSTAAAYAEPIIGFGVRRRATTTTSAGDDVFEPCVTSEGGPPREDNLVFALMSGAVEEQATPVSRGRAVFVVKPSDRLSWAADAVTSSHRFFPSWLASLGSSWRRTVPDVERLDWDAFLEVPPARPHGTIEVTLEFAGRAKPLPVDEDWY